MKSNRKTTAKAPPPPPATARIELDRVTHDDGKLVVEFSSGEHQWRLQCKAATLQSFGRFQRKVADHLGVWVDHRSQFAHLAKTRSEDWQGAVRVAFDRRAAG